MPPSGYSFQQAHFVCGFLRSCSEALRQESIQRDEAIASALSREIGDIQNGLTEHNAFNLLQRSLLALTKIFYERILIETSRTESDYSLAVEKTLEFIADEILDIHLTEYSGS